MRKSPIINISNFRTPNTLRIALEKSGEYIGFVRIEEKSTLADVRQVARGDLDDLPKEYTFVLGDGIPVSSRQERYVLEPRQRCPLARTDMSSEDIYVL